MNAKNGNIRVVDVDQTFPLLTSDGLARGSADSTASGDQGPAVASILRDVLGWRPRTQDTAAFLSALTASFQLQEIEGHVEATYVARGFAMQADLGMVSGGQASLYTRARAAVDQATQLLDSLEPLRPDADPEDCAAFRHLVRQEISTLVSELGTPGGPRQVVIESAFTVLAGASASGTVTADSVAGQLGALRDRFGLIDANVNTVEEERIRTSFWTLVDLITGLRASWQSQKSALSSGKGSGFLGTDLVNLSRLMAAAAEQLDDFEAVLTSAMVTPAERQTIMLRDEYGNPLNGLSLDGLIQWLRSFLTHDGVSYIRDAGRDGIKTAFAPTAKVLARIFRISLVQALAAAQQTNPSQIPVTLIPASQRDRLPPGMYAARSRIAVAGLGRQLNELFKRSAVLGRYPEASLYDVEIERVQPIVDDGPINVRLSLRGVNLRSTYLPAILRSGGNDSKLEPPSDGRSTADDDTLVGNFTFPYDHAFVYGLVSNYPSGAILPAATLPIGVVDGETGQVVSSPSVRTWPSVSSYTTGGQAGGGPARPAGGAPAAGGPGTGPWDMPGAGGMNREGTKPPQANGNPGSQV